MRALLWIQASGLAACCGTFVAAEAAAHLLEFWPAAPVLWWLNLKVFGFFRYARDPGSPLRFLFAPQAIWLALAVLGLIFVACASRKRLVLGSLANVAFALTGGLCYSFVSGRGSVQTASLTNTVLRPDW